jgi:hypothetical protein
MSTREAKCAALAFLVVYSASIAYSTRHFPHLPARATAAVRGLGKAIAHTQADPALDEILIAWENSII